MQCLPATGSCRSSSSAISINGCARRRPGTARASRVSSAISLPSGCGRRARAAADIARSPGSVGSPTESSSSPTSTASSMTIDTIVVDTWGWLALADDREPQHAAVRRLLHGLWDAGGAAVTTDYVLDETFTLVFRRLPFVRARRFVSILEAGQREGSLSCEWIGPQRFARATALRLRFRDKPRISFTDLTTMATMHELGLEAIVTADDHFRQVGLGFRTLP